MSELIIKGQKAKEASYVLMNATTTEKNNALLKMAEILLKNSEEILEANKKDLENVSMMSSDSYLKRLKLDDVRTNLDMVKEMYEDIKRETEDESEELLKTANLSLDILSDLRGDNDDTMIHAPIKDEFMPDDDKKFYSDEFKLSKRDFEDRKLEDNIELEMDDKKIKLKNKEHDSSLKKESDELDEDDEDDFYDNEIDDGNGKFFLKILLLIFGLILFLVVGIYLLNYFNRI